MAKGISRRSALAMAGVGAAAAACAPAPRATDYAGEVTFAHGVASGDPGLDRVVIWTRVTAAAGGEVPVRWVVARDAALNAVVADGEVVTGAQRDYTVKVDAAGLRPGQRYFFGFFAGQTASPVGRTRTLPRGRVDKAVIAVASCSNHPAGYFHAYAEIAKIDTLDLVMHLGDYIYEYGASGYASQDAAKLGRSIIPPHEIVSLADYRARHALYKTDPDLQAAHAAAPWLVIWDDHEVTNDTWVQGADNHQPETEGPFEARKAAALQAYYEWMPIRDPQAGRPFEAINRAFQYGDLVTIAMLETRLLARSQQLDYARDLQLISTAWDFTNPASPKPLPPGAPLGANVRVLPTAFDVTGPQPQPILEWARVGTLDPRNPPPGVAFLPDIDGFTRNRLNDPTRALLGSDQEGWLNAKLLESKKAGVPWRLLGNQVIMAKVNAPDFTKAPPPVLAAVAALGDQARSFIQLSRFGVPLNLDAWDGYPVARARVLEMLERVGGAIVVTGDTHTAWANQLLREGADAPVAAEFGTTSVSSPGFGDRLEGFDLAPALIDANPEVVWTDQRHRGYLLLTLTQEEARAEFHTVSTVKEKAYQAAVSAAFTVSPTPSGVSALKKVA